MRDFADDPVSSDPRFQGFIAWHGEVPREAKRLKASEARECAAKWIPERFRDDSKLPGHVLAYQLGARWWTVLFERTRKDSAPNDAENWWIESYAHDGSSWASNYFYWPADDCWRHFLHEFRGTNYGRHRND